MTYPLININYYSDEHRNILKARMESQDCVVYFKSKLLNQTIYIANSEVVKDAYIKHNKQAVVYLWDEFKILANKSDEELKTYHLQKTQFEKEINK